MRLLDLGYANTASRESEQGRPAPNGVDIVVVSERSLSALQREVASLAGKASKNKVEIVTNCKDAMLAAVGKVPEKVTQKGVVQKARFSGNTGAAIPPSRIRDFRFGTMEWRQAC